MNNYWPNGRGEIVIVTLGVPAAGAGWSTAVAAGFKYRLLGARATLTTAVAVANRHVRLRFSWDGVVTCPVCDANYVQPASLVVTYDFALGCTTMTGPLGTVAPAIQVALPLVYMGDGGTISCQTDSLQGADQWSAANLMFEVWRK